jgi:hypothetical protein
MGRNAHITEHSLCADCIIRKSGIRYADFTAYLDRTIRAVVIHDWDDRYEETLGGNHG